MTSMLANTNVYLRHLSINKRHQLSGTSDSGPLIGVKLRTHAQCALASRKQVESIGSPQRNTAKYSDNVAITIINNLQDISSTISATSEGVYNTSKGEIEAKQLN